MEWVETTGRTVADALDSALDELGVHEDDIEYEVLEEPKTGLFGRVKTDARVRVRLKPISREKPGDRRKRRGKGGGGGGGGRARGEGSGRSDGPGRSGRGRGSGSGRGDRGGDRSSGGQKSESGSTSGGGGSRSGGERSGGKSNGGGRGGRRGRDDESAARESEMDESTVPVERQAEVATGFTAGLVEAFGAQAQVSNVIDDEGTITVIIDGSDLGLLVGPRGATLNAVEELVKAVVQRETGGHGARLHVDVGGYRAKRREALADFTRKLAQQAIDSGEDQVLEPMQAPDRKVVHDTVGEIDGLETTSEGEDPRRYVVIRPV